MRSIDRKILATGFMMAWLLAPLASVQAATPTAPPASGLSKAGYGLTTGVTRKVLKNGLVVLIKEIHEQDTVAIEVVCKVGQAREDESNSGITTLLQNILQRRVSKADGEDDMVEATGSVLHTIVEPDYSEMGIETTGDHFKYLFGRVADAYLNRQFASKEVEAERTKLIQDLEGEQRVFKAIYDIFLEMFYRTHPYRQPSGGNVPSVKALSIDTLNAFYNRYYCPDRMVLSIVGDVNTAELLEDIDKTFGTLKAVDEPAKLIPWEAKGSQKDLQLSGGSNLAWIMLGYPAPSVQSPDYAAMRVMHSLMGEGISSRIWVDLREERGLAYELGSTYPVLEGPAHFLAYVITTPKQLKEARKRLFGEMDRLRQEDVSESELDAGRWKLIGSLLLEQETCHGKAFQMATAEIQGVGYAFPDAFVQNVRKVTAADVRRVANKYLDNYTIITAQPRESN